MKNLVVIFWAFLIGQAVAYIGASLVGAQYNFTDATIVSLVAGVIVSLIPLAMPKEPKEEQ